MVPIPPSNEVPIVAVGKYLGNTQKKEGGKEKNDEEEKKNREEREKVKLWVCE